MLPPPLRPGARPRSLSMSALPSTQARTIFGWRRSRCWESQIDPNYHRYNSWRNLKDRARLIKNIQRRAKFDWDSRTRSIFSPRYASHWNGGNNRPHPRYSSVDGKQESAEDEADPYELSKREKAWREEQAKAEHVRQDQHWKEQMEAMRKRLEADPYETVFGKRFEPFWSYWFPREDYGLPPKKSAAIDRDPIDVKATPSKPTTQPADHVKVEPAKKNTGQPSSFGYSSSTTWNSWTNKTQRTEWDSVSGEKKHFEYDPVSNRMVRIEPPVSKTSGLAESKALMKATSMSLANKDNTPKLVSKYPDFATARPVGELRRSIPIPITTVGDISSRGEYDSLKARLSRCASTTRYEERSCAERLQNHGDKQEVRNKSQQEQQPVKSQQLEKSLESLTASDLRASMGRSRDLLQTQNQTIQNKRSRRLQNKLKKDAKLHGNEPSNIEEQLKGFDSSVERLRGQVASIADQVMAPLSARHLQTSLQRGGQTSATLSKRHLQPSVERMQSKAQPDPVDLDDSAAHESTEPIPIVSKVPTSWNEQADMLQSERVKRTSGKLPFPPVPRWLDHMEARKAEFEKKKAAQPISAVDAQKAARLEKANALLEAEVAAQKLAMRMHEEASASKVRALRGEINALSTISKNDKQDRKDSKNSLSDGQATAESAKIIELETRYREKLRSLRTELDTAYKQSSVHADEFLDRIRKLEAEVARTAKPESSKPELATPVRKDSGIDTEMDIDAKAATHSEGDFCTNVTKFADSSKWYKRPQPSKEDIQKARDQALVRDVRQIYEGRYGIIDTEHRQVKDVALEQALAQHDVQYGFKDDGIEAELKNGPQVTAEDDGYAPKDYEYKLDGLEADLKELSSKEVEYASDAYVAAAPEARKPVTLTSREDLETLLKKQAAEKVAYASDEYEAEAQQCATTKANAVKAVQEDLETVLKKQATEKTAYASDEYEAEAQKCITKRVNAALKSVQEDLESEIRRKANEKVAYASDEYEAASQQNVVSRTAKTWQAVQEDLETTLKKQAAETNEYASDEYEAASQRIIDGKPKRTAQIIREDLETTLKRQAAEEAAYASDEYEVASRSASRNAPERASTFREDGLESELKKRTAEKAEYASDAYEAAAAQPAATASTASSASGDGSLQWHYPPVYKVLAYDAGNDLMSTATTSSWLTKSEEQALSISHALDQLYQPARFVPRFAEMQEAGFQVVHAGKDVLVFKKVLQAPEQTPKVKAAPQPAAAAVHPVNPVDGTARPREDIRPATGNFASPTGFVNYDPVPEALRPANTEEDHDEAEDIDYRHYPRVKREERVFSGTQRVGRRQWAQRRRAGMADEEEDRGNSRAVLAGSIFWIVLMVSGITYTVGWRRESVEKQKTAADTKAALEVKEARERAESGRWKLDGGFWKKE